MGKILINLKLPHETPIWIFLDQYQEIWKLWYQLFPNLVFICFSLFIAVLLRSRRPPAVTLLDNFVNLITNNWILDSFHSVMVTQLHFKLHICQSTEKKQSIKTLLIGGYLQCSKGRGEMDYSVSVFIIRKFLWNPAQFCHYFDFPPIW